VSELPKTIGRYEVRGELGRDALGIVLLAHDPQLDRAIALKTVEITPAVDAQERSQFEERFFIESRKAAALVHPNILGIQDVGRDEASGRLFMAFERLAGRTLAQVLEAGPALAWPQALAIAAQVAEGLHHAHGQQVVHRDLNPGNILVLDSGGVKILHFGVARIESALLKLTHGGEFLGAALYTSPERALGHEVDGRSDLFALGSIAYEMLTGTTAFGAPNLPQTIGRVVRDEPPAPTQLRAELPAAVDYVVARMLAKAPADRYPDGRTLAEDLEDVVAGREPRHRAAWARAAASTPGAPGDLDLEELFAHAVPAPAGPARDLEAELADLLPGEPPPPAFAPRTRRTVALVLAAALLLAVVLGAIALLRSCSSRTAGGQPRAVPAQGVSVGGRSAGRKRRRRPARKARGGPRVATGVSPTA
jgi:serine/threonine protein kinase